MLIPHYYAQNYAGIMWTTLEAGHKRKIPRKNYTTGSALPSVSFALVATSCHSQFLTEEIENQLFLLAQSSKGTTYLWEWFTELPRVLCLLIEKSFDMCLASSQLSNKFNQIGLLSSNLNALGLLLTLFVCNLADGYSVI